MPPKKKGSSKQQSKGGSKPGAAAKASTDNVPRRKKHQDPYAAATGSTLDEIVKSIEAPQPKAPQPANSSASPKVANSDTKGESKAHKGQPPSKVPKGSNPTPTNRGAPTKQGMTKAQRRDAQHRPPAAEKLRPLPKAEDFQEEEEEKGSNNEDYSDTANERAKEYRKGGYHPVVIGDVYNERYRIVKKLGWGYFSTVWLVWDYVTETFQALKIQKSAEHYKEAAYDEIRLLSEIMNEDVHRDRCCTRMNDFFEHVGPNGSHVCMVFDVLGENLLSLIEWYEYRGIPLAIVKAIAQQVLIGLEHIHSINILHTDLKPENVLLSTPKYKFLSIMKHYRPPPLHVRPSLVSKDVKSMTKSQRRRYYQKMKKEGGTKAPNARSDSEPPQEGVKEEADGCSSDNKQDAPTTGATPVAEDWGLPPEDTISEPDPDWELERFHHVALADFGNGCWTHRQFTDEVQTRQYRSPEVILGAGYSTPLDLWSAACMFFELITGEFLFDPKQGDNYSRDEDHLALMSELLGELPEHMRTGSGKYRSQFYTSDGRLRHIQQLNFWGLSQILHEKYHFTAKKANEIAEFLMPMLELDPNNRLSATDMLNNFQHFFEVQDDDYRPHCYVDRDDAAADDNDADGERSDDQGDDHQYEDDDVDEADDAGEEETTLASKADEDELKKWWDNHPLLNAKSLRERGLTVKDVQRALAGQAMDTVEQQTAVENLLVDLEAMEQDQ